MGFCRTLLGTSLIVVMLHVVHGQPLVPALYMFGDSIVDVGNNNHLDTLVKANFPPYGRDFVTHEPTGRFCNGKLATDFTAENLGFTTYPPAYLSKGEKNLSTGANFASASSGYYDKTAKLYSAISLPQQVEYFKEYQTELVSIAGISQAASIINGSIYMISAGSSDFLQNYYINPFLYEVYTPDEFSDLLMESVTSIVQNLYQLGARRIGITTLPPLGCLPAAITLFSDDENQCITKLNQAAVSFNNKLNATSLTLTSRLSGLKMVVFDIYQPLLDLINKPSDNGFFEARKACCGTGTIETSLLCNSKSIGTCNNATEYVFWDGFHPSEAANKILADNLLIQGIDLIT